MCLGCGANFTAVQWLVNYRPPKCPSSSQWPPHSLSKLACRLAGTFHDRHICPKPLDWNWDIMGYLTRAWQRPAACWVCGALTADQSSAHVYCMSHRWMGLVALGRNLCRKEREGQQNMKWQVMQSKLSWKSLDGIATCSYPNCPLMNADILSHADHKRKCQAWVQSEQEGLVTVSLFDPLEQLSASRRGWLVIPSSIGTAPCSTYLHLQEHPAQPPAAI